MYRRIGMVLFYIMASALAFCVLDLPVRFSEFVSDMPTYMGIKNAVAPATGLLLGPWGVIGTALGALLCGVIDPSAQWNAIAYEIVVIVIEGLGTWLIWHIFTPQHKVRFKKFQDLLKYSIIVTVLAAVSTGLGYLFVDDLMFIPTFLTAMLLAILIGVPAVIIYSGVMCQQPVIPAWYTRYHDIETDVEPNDDSFMALNDQIEELTEQLGLSKRRNFEVMNTVEEVYLRIRTREPNAVIHVTIDCEDVLSLNFEYPGEKNNPLRVAADEDLVALIGLKLIEHRAIRTSYQYWSQTNRVLIVL